MVQESSLKPIPTTVLGAMKKPEYLKIPTWTDKDDANSWSQNTDKPVEDGVTPVKKTQPMEDSESLEKLILQATEEVIEFQSKTGINVITDGEMRRTNYIYPFCETLNGFDPEKVKVKTARNGNWTGSLPCFVSEVSMKPESERADLSREWRVAQDLTDVPLKYTIPGPLTIADSTCNCFYTNEEDLLEKLAEMVNHTILQLVSHGCKFIQVDEPVLARYPHTAANTIKNVERCFQGVPDDVTKIVHICCGYPLWLDQTDYEKAEPGAYLQIADALNNSIVDQISFEDAHRRNPKELFEKLHKKTIILGVVDVSRSRVETVDEIVAHVKDVLQYFPRDQLVLAPDCGLIMLPHDIMTAKLTNMVAAAKLV